MFNSTVLDVAFGLIFCFASVALSASSANEALASFFRTRSKTLKKGIKALLDSPTSNQLVTALYGNSLVNPLKTGTPAYIPAAHFAAALVDSIGTTTHDLNALRIAVSNLPTGSPLQLTLLRFLDRSSGDINVFENHVADWFDSAMDRLSGSYKRHAQAWTFFIALFFAATLNVDAIYITTQLWNKPALVAAIEGPSGTTLISALSQQSRDASVLKPELPAAATTLPKPSNPSGVSNKTDKPGEGTIVSNPNVVTNSEAASGSIDAVASTSPKTDPKAIGASADQLQAVNRLLGTLPVGWNIARKDAGASSSETPTSAAPQLTQYGTRWGILVMAAGWIITATSALFGAPFWFDLLQQIIQIRGTGTKPPTNKDRNNPTVVSTATP